MKKFYNVTLTASFTIEATVIIPITMIMIVWLITSSLNIHSQVVSYTSSIYKQISAACDEHDNVSDNQELSGKDPVDPEKLNARKELLKYRIIKDGIRSFTGGFSDEN